MLLSIYIEDEIKKLPLLLGSKISPPIFVDSRKSARDNKKIKNKHLKKFIDVFHPSIFEKNYLKKESKGEESYEEEI